MYHSASSSCIPPPSQLHFLLCRKYISSSVANTFSALSQIHFLLRRKYISCSVSNTFPLRRKFKIYDHVAILKDFATLQSHKCRKLLQSTLLKNHIFQELVCVKLWKLVGNCLSKSNIMLNIHFFFFPAISSNFWPQNINECVTSRPGHFFYSLNLILSFLRLKCYFAI